MVKLVVITDPFSLREPTAVDCDDVCAELRSQFETWPDTARIYHNVIAQSTDITPKSQEDVDRLSKIDGVVFVVVYPADPVTATIAVVALVVGVAAAVFLPKLLGLGNAPQAVTAGNNANRQQGSANNELSERQNVPRISARIPDIYGKVRSTPELITVPYTVFKSNQEVEYAVLCVGRGRYVLSDIRDDTTPLEEISGTSLEIYEPYTSPNFGEPSRIIGEKIIQPMRRIKRLNSVNGQVLRAVNGATYNGSDNVFFIAPNELHTSNSDIDFTDSFDVGMSVALSNAVVTSAAASLVLNGTYEILSVSSNVIVFNAPSNVNPDWARITLQSSNCSATIVSTGANSIGSFLIDDATTREVICNFVAPNGLYKTDGTSDIKFNVELEVKVKLIETNEEIIRRLTLEGSATARGQRGVSCFIELPTGGKCRVEARRITPKDTIYAGTVIDEVRWRDCFGASQISASHFGDVTTLHLETYATAGALAVKNRKLNMLASRLIPSRRDGSGDVLIETSNVADIIHAVALDAFCGNRSIDELDSEAIYSTIDEVISYFGFDEAGSFNYTFDNLNVSFEEMIASVAGAANCTAFRQGSKIKLSFERANNPPRLLFNHRNKLPGTETRTIKFGRSNDYDGVEYNYVSAYDGSKQTIYLPPDQSAINPQVVDSVGISDTRQATIIANRIYNKLKHQMLDISFDATQEAIALVNGERILVSNTIKSSYLEGEIVNQVGLILQLSQRHELTDATNCFIQLQLYDGSIDVIELASIIDDYNVSIKVAPKLPLQFGNNIYAPTAYAITCPNNEDVVQSFIVISREQSSNFTATLKAINYDARYYANDLDFRE